MFIVSISIYFTFILCINCVFVYVYFCPVETLWIWLVPQVWTTDDFVAGWPETECGANAAFVWNKVEDVNNAER